MLRKRKKTLYYRKRNLCSIVRSYTPSLRNTAKRKEPDALYTVTGFKRKVEKKSKRCIVKSWNCLWENKGKSESGVSGSVMSL